MGILKGEKREIYCQKFRDVHGELNGAIVSALPGWKAEAKQLENCGQISAQYIDPTGYCWKLIKDIEAKFAMDMEKGRELPDFDVARANALGEDGKPMVSVRQN